MSGKGDSGYSDKPFHWDLSPLKFRIGNNLAGRPQFHANRERRINAVADRVLSVHGKCLVRQLTNER
jgi:hypothetical protein